MPFATSDTVAPYALSAPDSALKVPTTRYVRTGHRANDSKGLGPATQGIAKQASEPARAAVRSPLFFSRAFDADPPGLGAVSFFSFMSESSKLGAVVFSFAVSGSG
eukprot:2443867-Rhodomonas_salina.4